MREYGDNPRLRIRRLNMLGFLLLLLLVGVGGGWASTFDLAGAVIAPGVVSVESNIKKVQHPNGGVVGAIFVKDGDFVAAGQLLVRLDDTVTRANLGIVKSQLDELLARQARLTAERDHAANVTFPKGMLDAPAGSHIAIAVAGEEKLFESRRSGRLGQQSQLRERIAQTEQEIKGLNAQAAAKATEAKLTGEELSGVSDLYKQNLVSIMRYMQLKRDLSRLEGEQGQLVADIARAHAKISETQLQIIQLDRDFNSEVLKDLRETEGKIAELKERVIAAEDQLRRIDIRSPQDGYVTELAVHTVGGVVNAGQTIMNIVPSRDRLIVEAKVAPHDVDRVLLGSATTTRILAGNVRATPEIKGVVTYVSADQMRDERRNQSYFLVHASLPPQEIARLGDLKLLPGMPVELFIDSGARTALQYLLKPLREQIARTFRER